MGFDRDERYRVELDVLWDCIACMADVMTLDEQKLAVLAIGQRRGLPIPYGTTLASAILAARQDADTRRVVL